MRRTLTVSLVAALALAGFAAADEPQSAAKGEKAKVISQQPAAQADSPLVRAAKAAKKSRQKSGEAEKAITNESVKKSKGRLTILAESAEPAEVKQAAAQDEAKARAEAAAGAEKARLEVKNLQAEVARLEKEMAAIETGYYDEYDAELRENLWEEKFGKAKAALEAARARLADAQKRQQELAAAAGAPKQ